MMRSRISAAAFRVNVIARMWAGSMPRLQEVDVPLDEHTGLARARRCFEDDVLGWVFGEDARSAVGVKRADRPRPARRGSPKGSAVENHSSPT